MAFFGEHETVEPSVSARVPLAHVGEREIGEDAAAFCALEKHKGIACMRAPYRDGLKLFVTCRVKMSHENERYRFAELDVECVEVDHEMA